ncbi:MAG: alpha-glucosidase C-terminal domain-containing protein, partial [Rikenellaceae bacterium]|nr:alpha-glucosidase C-terminal domain-containing protein [Rikenellaceae bacterium]
APDTGIDFSLTAFKRMFVEWDEGVKTGWPTVYLGNHDQPRMVSRFGNDTPRYREISAKMLTTFLLSLRGTVYWYAGDELGMSNARFNRIEDYNDIETVNAYKKLKKSKGNLKEFFEIRRETSRDNARTPFQWDDSVHAGFTTGHPWLPVNPNYPTVNVQSEEDRPDSALNYFRRMRELRRASPALNYGRFELICPDDPQVFAYRRLDRGETMVVLLNFSDRDVIFDSGMEFRNSRLVLSNYPEAGCPVLGQKMSLRPYEALVYQL